MENSKHLSSVPTYAISSIEKEGPLERQHTTFPRIVRERGLKGKHEGKPVFLCPILDFDLDEDYADVFLLKIKDLTSISHPNLAYVYGLVPAKDGSGHYLMFSYPEKGMLSDVVGNLGEGGRFSLTERDIDFAVNVALCISSGAQFIYQNGYTTDFINPTAIGIDSDDQAMIMYYGDPLPQPRMTMGRSKDDYFNEGYVVPGAEDPFTEKAAVHNIGLVLYYALTGHHIFSDVPKEKRNALAYKGIKPTIPKYVPAELNNLIQWCWTLDPNGRPSFKEITEFLTEKRDKIFEK